MRPLTILAVLAGLAGVTPLATAAITSDTPFYTSEGIVNAATQTAGALAPNAIATLYGTDLAFSTRAIAATDIVRGVMPTKLDGVGVWINSTQCALYYISPTQINFLVPYGINPSTVTVIVTRDAVAGPAVQVQLNATSPGFFLLDGINVAAVHLNGDSVSDLSPAAPGEVIVIYATGLGRTTPNVNDGQLATGITPIYYLSQLQVLLNGVPCPPGSLLYAGLAPGFAGLYQINLTLPPDAPPNPEIRLAIGDQTSPESVRLAIQ